MGGKIMSINSMLQLDKHLISIKIDEKVFDIVEENSIDKRKFLFDEYEDLIHLLTLVEKHELENCETFSWKLCMDKGWLSFQNLGHFKNEILLNGISEEEWKRYINEHWNHWTTEKIESLLQKYDEYRENHGKMQL
jgi:hypothetical protein